MRVTNIGVIGNAFCDNGLSDDPSFEYRAGSGIELPPSVTVRAMATRCRRPSTPTSLASPTTASAA
jgi:hypothetical protein